MKSAHPLPGSLRVWMLCGLLGCFGGRGHTAQQIVTVAEDTWIHGLTSSVVAGKDNRLSICPVANYWIYLRFDLPDPIGEVTAAELRMTRFEGARPDEIVAYFIQDDAWSETSLTGMTRPSPRDPEPSAVLASGVSTEGHDSWQSDALEERVSLELSGDGILTLMIREDPDPQLDVRHYYSREGAPAPEQAPRLVLQVREPEQVADGWEVHDLGPGTKPALDFGPDDSLHVMAMTEAMDGEVWYATSQDPAGPWLPRTVATGYFYGPGDLRVGPDGSAHLAWHNHDAQNPDHLVVLPDGQTPRYTIDTPGHDGWDNTLAFDGEGRLHQASIFPLSFGAEMSLQHGIFQGGEWSYETVQEPISTMYGLATSIAVDRDGEPHVALCMAEDWTTPGALVYAFRKDGEWTVDTVVDGGPRGRFPSLALDHWDRPQISWIDIDVDDHSHGHVRYGVLNSGVWEIETVDELQAIRLGHFDARRSTSLVLDRNSRPHLAYGDSETVCYATKPFGTWERLTALSQGSPGSYKGLVVLRLDSSDRPAIVLWEETEAGEGLVRLATTAPVSGEEFRRGDCNDDGTADISDAISTLGFLFLGEGEPGCRDACDSNDDGKVDISDAVSTLRALFLGEGSLPPPGGIECGPDPTADESACTSYTTCP